MAYRALACPLVQQLVQTIQSDYHIVDDLAAKYLGTQSLAIETPVPTPAIVATIPATPVVPKKSKKSAVDPCSGRTAKGDPCRFKVKCDGLCGIHLRQRDQPVTEKKAKDGSTVPKKSAASKKKADPPKHTHTPLETDPECGLCEVQGNVVVPELTKAEFEAVEEEGSSIQERLRAILAGAEDDEDDEVPVSTSESVEPEEPEEEPEKPLDTMGDLMAALPTVDEPEESEDIDLRVKLAKLIAEEDSDSDMYEDVIEQMSETPPSQAKLAKFQELLEEMEA